MSTFIRTCDFSLFSQSRLLARYSFYKRSLANNASETEDKVTETQDNSNTLEREHEIERIRDKSRMKPQHRNMLFNVKPFLEPATKHHLTIKYSRKMFGKYGSESGVNPGIMWPTKLDIEDRIEFEKIAYPLSLQEMVAVAKEELEIKELEIQKRQVQIRDNLSKLDAWKKELKEKLAKREAEAVAVREKKEALIEEVRRHFGFTVDPKDDRFKEMLVVKEKEQKKKEKQARQEEKEKKAIKMLMEKNKPAISTLDTSVNSS